MIIVTGSLVAREDTFDELLRLSLEHVHRSRREPGCLAHGVYRDGDNPLRLFFYEEWADRGALLAHFAVPESGAFVKAARPLCADASGIEIFEAERIPRQALG